ncbi:MAG: hypothetical protein GXO25_04035 [Euryarchaeota archaeon]|nr:hypothetical protein [Euryarchaeota archaeon]
MATEKLVAQAKAYYIIGFGRDRFIFDDKKWVIGKIYLTNKRLIFKKFDRTATINYADIQSIAERDKYYRVSPPMGWSKGSILEIKHYEAGRNHILTTLISGEFDVITTMRGIISKFAMHSEQKLTKEHKKILILLSMGIRDKIIIQYITDITVDSLNKIIDELKLAGYINESLNLTTLGRKTVAKIRENVSSQEKIK